MSQLTLLTIIFFSSLSSIAGTPSNFVYIPPPKIELDAEDQATLNTNQRIFKEFQINDKKQKAVIFRVNASRAHIWQIITNYESYPQWARGVKHTHIYQQDSQNYYVEFTIGHWLLGKFKYNVWHYHPNDSWMKWQLDKNKESDFSVSTGFWQIVKVENTSATYDVYYSVDLEFKKPKSKSIREKAINAGLKRTSIWVKREAENLAKQNSI